MSSKRLLIRHITRAQLSPQCRPARLAFSLFTQRRGCTLDRRCRQLFGQYFPSRSSSPSKYNLSQSRNLSLFWEHRCSHYTAFTPTCRAVCILLYFVLGIICRPDWARQGGETMKSHHYLWMLWLPLLCLSLGCESIPTVTRTGEVKDIIIG